jgi:hypothetical protein
MLVTEAYSEQIKVWPKTGHHILAQFDDTSIIVYQAYRPSIGRHAAEHGCFGGDFDFDRMSWVKPNFLWMMYRSGWGTKQDQLSRIAARKLASSRGFPSSCGLAFGAASGSDDGVIH